MSTDGTAPNPWQIGGGKDWRHITNGWVIPAQHYCDQPYVVKADDGAWVCIMTTGSGREGASGQHVRSYRSTDCGKTWEEPVLLEPPEGVEASYAVMLKVPSGRLYAFYNHNTDDIRKVKADNPPYKDGYCRRVDSLGHFVFKYSDDHGKSWSEKRYEIPQRLMEIDRNNCYGGDILFFWNVGKAFTHDNAGYVPLHKCGNFGHGFFTSNEGVLLRSDNILTEEDPEKITWETLPEGEHGIKIRRPDGSGGGPVSGEHSFSVLSDGSIFVVFRTVDGHPAISYSRDNGRSFALAEYMRYDDGRLVKHPRAANFAWRASNGKFLYWCHQHGGKDYDDRNPVWVLAGVEGDSPGGKVIRWSQPEVLLYDDDTYIRMSYPDFVEDDGRYFITETQKSIARTHEIAPDFLDLIWSQFDRAEVAEERCVLALPAEGGAMPAEAPAPKLPVFIERDRSGEPYGTLDRRNGFSIDLWFQLDTLEPGQVLLDNRLADGHGFCLRTSDRETIELVLNDGRTENRWDCDPGMIQPGQHHHLTAIVDGGPHIVWFVTDGCFNDGGTFRQFGWGRFNPHLRDVNGADALRIGEGVEAVRLYARALRTTEAIGNWRAGAK